MRRPVQIACVLGWMALLVLPALPAPAERRDPLTEDETDQLREVAQEAPLRFKLLIKFTGQRLASAEALRADPKAGPDRARHIHDLLEDFTTLMDELSDNVDAYASRKEDLRKPLPYVIAAANDWAARLKDFKTAAAASPADAKAYGFVLQDAIEAVESGLHDAQQLLEEQKEEFKNKK